MLWIHRQPDANQLRAFLFFVVLVYNGLFSSERFIPPTASPWSPLP